MLNKLLGASALGVILASGFAMTAQAQASDPECEAGSAAGTLQCGNLAQATEEDATALGDDSIASSEHATAIGNFARATGIDSTAIGDDSLAQGTSATALGQDAQALGVNSTAIGKGATVSLNTERSTAVGRSAKATASQATAIGDSAQANASMATALGTNSDASFENSTAIGVGAQTLFANQFMFGTASNTHTMPGIVSDASRAAQSGDLEFVMTDGSGNLASDGGIVDARIAAAELRLSNAEAILATPSGQGTYDDTALNTAVNTNAVAISTVSSLANSNQARIANAESTIIDNSLAISQLNNQFETLGLQVDELTYILADNTEQIAANTAGIAIANAMAGTSWLQANETHAFTANWGFYDNANAFALSATQRLDQNWSANMGIGYSPDEGKVGARAGVRLGW